jgi:AcrR family transcriptional regulator
MDLLATETGISKTTMFKHFRSKEELILAVLRLRDQDFRNWMFRRMEEAGPPRAQLTAMFDALAEWFASPGFRSCMFIKAASEYPAPDHPIHAQAAEHKRLLFRQLSQIAAAAGAPEPASLARALLILKEGAIVTAHLGHEADPAGDAKSAAEALLSTIEFRPSPEKTPAA